MELGLGPCLPESKSPPCSVTSHSAANASSSFKETEVQTGRVSGSRSLILGPQLSSPRGLSGSPHLGRQRQHNIPSICVHTHHHPSFSLPSPLSAQVPPGRPPVDLAVVRVSLAPLAPSLDALKSISRVPILTASKSGAGGHLNYKPTLHMGKLWLCKEVT